MNATKNFGGIKPDANRKFIHTGHGLSFRDSSATVKSSPYSYTSSEFQLKAPSNAAEVWVKPSTSIKVGTQTGLAEYVTIPAKSSHMLGIADIEDLYFEAAEAGSLEFYFVTV